jgi:serine/threonine protein kinase
MQFAGIAVKPDGRETTTHVGGPAASADDASSAGQFLYASGSRPLAGYTIKRGVGIGGFGEIYYAVSDAGKEVALKLVRRHLDVELRGIRHCLNLKHPNLVSLYDIRQDEQQATWVVMEYVAGQSLQDVIEAHPQGMPVEQVLAWLHGIAAAIGYLHDRGIVHRDLKPANLFCDEGLVKVGDYGLSKFISCSRRSGHTESIGTVHYMAPEVANGRYGKEIDIYALGVILYEMLTGRVPFDGESVGEVLMKHLTATPDVSMLYEPFRSAVVRALEKDPARRFQSVGEMLHALPPAPLATSGILSGVGMSAAQSLPPQAPGQEESVLRWMRQSVGQFRTALREGVSVARSQTPPPHSQEEPILRWIRQSVGQLRAAWRESKLGAPARTLVLAVGLFVLVASAGSWLPMVVLLLMVYGMYRVVRAGVRWWRPEPKGPPPLPAAGPAVATWHQPAPAPRPDPRALLRARPTRVKVRELLGSMLAAALVAATMCLMMTILAAYRGRAPQATQIAWLVSVSIVASWAVLIPCKAWEGRRGEAALRRFVLLLSGLAVGLFASGVHAFLTFQLPDPTAFLPPDPELTTTARYQLPQTFYLDGSPRTIAYVACFATLFFLLRWWQQADPLRAARMSFASTVVCAVMAGVVAAVWHFPQPWLVMVAAVMSVSIQLASPRVEG